MSLNIPLFNSHLLLATYQIESRSIEVVRQPDGQVSAKSGDGRNYTLKGLPSSHLSPEHIKAARDYFAHAKPISDPFTDSLSFAGSLKGGGAGASSLFGPRRSEEVQQQTALIKAAAKNNDSAKFNQLIEEFSKIFSKLPTQPFSVVRDLIETLNAMQEFPLTSKVEVAYYLHHFLDYAIVFGPRITYQDALNLKQGVAAVMPTSTDQTLLESNFRFCLESCNQGLLAYKWLPPNILEIKLVRKLFSEKMKFGYSPSEEIEKSLRNIVQMQNKLAFSLSLRGQSLPETSWYLPLLMIRASRHDATREMARLFKCYFERNESWHVSVAFCELYGNVYMRENSRKSQVENYDDQHERYVPRTLLKTYLSKQDQKDGENNSWRIRIAAVHAFSSGHFGTVDENRMIEQTLQEQLRNETDTRVIQVIRDTLERWEKAGK